MRTKMFKAMSLLIVVMMILLLYVSSINKAGIEKEMFIMEGSITLDNVTVMDVYDNVEFDSKFKIGFGFGAIVKLPGKTILFDTGGDSSTLLANIKKAGVKPENIDIVVLSHIHGDHTGGLLGFLEKNSNVTVYVPSSFPGSFKDEIKEAGAKVVDVSDPVKILEGVYSTGELGISIKEQSLIVDTARGLAVMTGCAHPGIVDIVRKAKELTGKNVYLVMGGFHSPPLSTIKEFRKLGVEKVAPSHCTGDGVIDAFEKEYKDDFIESGVGKIIEIRG